MGEPIRCQAWLQKRKFGRVRNRFATSKEVDQLIKDLQISLRFGVSNCIQGRVPAPAADQCGHADAEGVARTKLHDGGE